MRFKNCNYDASVLFNSPTVKLRGMIDARTRQEAACSPEDFRGDTTCIFYKFNYVYPYEKLDGLRRYILTVKDKTGLRNQFRGYIAIDLTEWADHVDEDYFNIFIMYLADHTDGINYLLFFGNRDIGQKEHILSTLYQYMRIRILDPARFGDSSALKNTRREI